MIVTKDQVKIANELLKRLCESDSIDADELYSMFNDKNEINYIIKFLEKYNLVHALWSSGGNVAAIITTDLTENAVKNNILETEYNKQIRIIEKENIEIELAKSNLEANKRNMEMAARNEKNEMTNRKLMRINIAVGLTIIAATLIQVLLFVLSKK